MPQILSARVTSTPTSLARENSLLETAESWNQQGKLEFDRGNAQAALINWKQAEIAYRNANFEEGIVGSQINQAQAMEALGKYLQAVDLLKEIKKFLAAKPNSELKIVALRSLGDVWRLTGDLKKSEEVLNEGLKLAIELPSPQNISAVQLSLGNTALARSKRAKSVSDEKQQQSEIEKALSFYELVESSDADLEIKLQAQLNRLKILVDNREWSASEKLWPQINDNISQLPNDRLSIEVRVNLAHTLLEMKQNSQQISDWQDISKILTTAWQTAESIKDVRSQSYVLGNLGSLYEATKQSNHAREITEQALNLAQSIQAWDIAYQWQWQLGRLYGIEEREKAIAAYSKAVENLQYLRKNLVAIDPEAQFSFRDDVEPVYRELVDLLLRSESPENQPSQENLRKAIEQIDGLQLAEIENFLRCNISTPVAIDRVTDPQAAIIYPIILDKRLAVILQLPGQQEMKYYQTVIDRSNVENTLKKLRLYLSRSGSETPEVIQESKKLYEWIIKPFEEVLDKNNQIKTLVFVLDGALRNIPMTVLYDSDRKQYLIEKDYAIAISPRLQLFTPKPLDRKLKVFVGGVGEPQTINNISFQKIEYLEAELKGIAKEINTKPPLLNASFTKRNLQLQLEMGDFSVIHLKTHGVFSSDPDNTFIVGYNELIKGKDLANLIETRSQDKSKNIELLVLSACETAKGDNRAVLGLAGIAVRAGARSTLSTLWKAQDEPNTELMLRFYKELSKPGTSRAKALQIAQKALFEKYLTPHIWASYILVGNWL